MSRQMEKARSSSYAPPGQGAVDIIPDGTTRQENMGKGPRALQTETPELKVTVKATWEVPQDGKEKSCLLNY